ncbi:MAG: hypothetical protein L6R39_005500 [Caloplaca ligustica]|nr:MAG: hypothetical protein L6R39_005500 [Caloplaca ligustica]
MDIPPASPFPIYADISATYPSSPSRSPHKQYTSTARPLNPLLPPLSSSPALDTSEAPNSSHPSSQDAGSEIIADASPSERALAVRAASAAKALEEWHQELQQWPWPSSHNGFETPGQQEPAPNSSAGSEHALRMQGSSENVISGGCNGIAQEYWGSLPAHAVLDYENRIEAIRNAMDALELDQMKAHIRDVHMASTSRLRSSAGIGESDAGFPSYDRMDDVTAIVTTIIMQALPLTFRVEALLGVWEVRLTVSRAAPGFINTMRKTQQDMVVAWTALDQPRDNRDNNPLAQPHVLGLKTELEAQIRDLGQRLDFMLDTLEGRQETLPDVWIDDMERLEQDFGNWVVEADKIAIDWELRDRHYGPTDSLLDAHSTARSATKDGGHTVNGGERPVNHSKPSTTIDQALDGSSSPPELVSDSGSTSLYHGVSHQSHENMAPNGHRPSPLNLQHRRNHSIALSNLSSESSYPGSATSDYFSNASSPEIHDASKTEYFGVGSPVEIITPGLPRRESRASQETVTRQSSQRTEQGDRSLSAIASPSRSRASTIVQEPPISEGQHPAAVSAKKDRRSLPNLAFGNGIPSAQTGMVHDRQPTPPIPIKSKHRFEDFTDLSPGNTPVKVIRRTTADAVNMPTTPHLKKNRTPTASPAKSTEDELEARISSILTDIPADIRLARGPNSRSGANAQSPANRVAKFVKKSAAPRLMRSQTAIPSPAAMTLTPANQKTARAQNGDPEIKLYHLHQSDTEAPIKLFVRLVGEGGERVMVRIGGGWADLAEYLKEYAIHHGRRAVSDGRFDIQGLPHSQSSSPVATLGSLPNAQTPKSRPQSPEAQRSTPGPVSRSRRSSTGISGFPCTPEDDPLPPDDIRPTSRDSNASSRRSWIGDDSPSLGLAGPKSRKATVSPNKQAWVDTMVERARSGSSEKKKGTRNAFDDLGIMGGTRRLFMRRETEM